MELISKRIEEYTKQFDRLVTEGYFSGAETDDNTTADADEFDSGTVSNVMFIQKLATMLSIKNINILRTARMIEVHLQNCAFINYCSLSCVTVLNDRTGESRLFHPKEIPATTGWLYDSDIIKGVEPLAMMSIRYHFFIKPITETGSKMSISRFFVAWKKLISALQKITIYHPDDSAAFLFDEDSDGDKKTRIPIAFVPNTKEGIINIYRQFLKKEPSDEEQYAEDMLTELHMKSFNTKKFIQSVEAGLKKLSDNSAIYGKIAKREFVAPGTEQNAFVMRIDFRSATGNAVIPVQEFLFDFKKNVADEVPLELYENQIPVVFSMFFDKTVKIENLENKTIKNLIDSRPIWPAGPKKMIRANRSDTVTVTLKDTGKEQQNCRFIRCQYIHNPKWRYFIAFPKSNGCVAGNPENIPDTLQKEELSAALKNLS